MLDCLFDNDPLMEVALECTTPLAGMVMSAEEAMFGPIEPSMFFGREEEDIDSSTTSTNTDSTNTKSPKKDDEQPLDGRFKLGGWDVLCGRGKQVSDHEGNKRLRHFVESSIEQYESSNRQEKSALVRAIVQKIQNASPLGGFVRKDSTTGQWYNIGTSNAHDKVGHAFRDYIRKSRRLSNSDSDSSLPASRVAIKKKNNKSKKGGVSPKSSSTTKKNEKDRSNKVIKSPSTTTKTLIDTKKSSFQVQVPDLTQSLLFAHAVEQQQKGNGSFDDFGNEEDLLVPVTSVEFDSSFLDDSIDEAEDDFWRID